MKHPARSLKTNHPYYASEGNYFSNGCHTEHESWSDFIEEEGDGDLDMNLIYRWDWSTPDPDDYDPAGEPDYPMPDHDTLKLFYIGQRKALARSVFVTVHDDDEDAVMAWLQVRADHLRLVWAPLLGEA